MQAKRAVVQAASYEWKKVVRKLEFDAKGWGTAVQRTVSDLRSRLPGKVADDVRTRYNIKKSEIMPSKAEKGKGAGKVRIKGTTLADLSLTYTGRRLTHTHFGMTPKRPPVEPKNKPEKGPGARKHRKLEGTERADFLKRRRVKIKAQVLKGKRKVIHPQAFLANTGGVGADKVHYIPFKREGKKRAPIDSVKTVSVPQMVSNPNVRPLIEEDMSKLLRERLAKHAKRFIDRKQGG